jgi:putative phosphoesterase
MHITRRKERAMAIGIISDTHDDMEQMGQAVRVFNERHVSHVIHAGDHVSPFVFEVLDGLTCPFTGIFGNNDGDRVLLKEKSRGSIFVQPHMLELEGRRIVVVHEPPAVEALAASGHFDVVVYGHLHEPDVRKVGGCLVINPGKAARLHKGTSTVAILDTAALMAEIIGL